MRECCRGLASSFPVDDALDVGEFKVLAVIGCVAEFSRLSMSGREAWLLARVQVAAVCFRLCIFGSVLCFC